MRIQIASDLHLEFLRKRFPGYRCVEPAQADLLVLAGDIHTHGRAIDCFRDWEVPVLYIHGNHELYNEHHAGMVGRLREAAAGTGIRYLERDEVRYGGVRFLGCCLWTDYALYPERQAVAMQEAETYVMDHRFIRTDDGFWTVRDAQRLHRESRAWLAEKLEQPFAGPTVVITHHAPHILSVHPRYEGTLVNAAFASDLTPLLGKAALWIHGHMHDSFDYEVNGTRVLTNPRGYPLNLASARNPEEIEWENPLFDPRLVVEIPAGNARETPA
ncbi:MAG: metallophosphoesterase [Noviherbaspirillum sp.]